MPTTKSERLILTEYAKNLDKYSCERVYLNISYELLNQLRDSSRKSGIEGARIESVFQEIEVLLHVRYGDLGHKYNDAYRITSELEVREILEPSVQIYEIKAKLKK